MSEHSGGGDEGSELAEPEPFIFPANGEDLAVFPETIVHCTFLPPNEYQNYVYFQPMHDKRPESRRAYRIYPDHVAYTGLVEYLQQHRSVQILNVPVVEPEDDKKFFARHLRDLGPRRRYLPREWENEAQDWLGDYGFNTD